jgi:choline-sulfatase
MISRRSFLSSTLAATALAQTNSRPKNVLLLMSDQHRPHALSIDGNPVAKTPNLDTLAASGVRFDSSYCSNPVCVPSRASLLTGLYTHNHGALNNSIPWPFEHQTIAHHFHRAGYMTGLIGKMHFVDAQTHGFDYHLDFNDWWQYLGPKTKLYAEELSRANSGSGMPQINDLWHDAGDPWKGVRDLDDREGPVAVGRVSKMAEQDHFESFVSRESVRFLKDHGKEPFFLVSSFLKPHDPFMPAARFASMFRPEDMKLPDTWGKVDLSKVPKEIRESVSRNAPTPELHNVEQAKRRIAFYYASLAQMDDCLGRVLQTLRELGLEKDTIVLYTTDHGEMLAEHGLWQKFVFYEPSVGVPLIVRAPGVTPSGARSKTPVSLVQTLPTLLDLCALPAVSGLDGTSFAEDLRNPARTRDTTVYAEYNLGNPRAKYMIRRGDYKYNYYVNDMAELYNLQEDPKEMRNLALEPASARKVEELKAQLSTWHKPV